MMSDKSTKKNVGRKKMFNGRTVVLCPNERVIVLYSSSQIMYNLMQQGHRRYFILGPFIVLSFSLSLSRQFQLLYILLFSTI